MDRSTRSGVGIGILLIVLGLLFMPGQLFPGIFERLGGFTWPVIVVGVGVFLFMLGLITDNPGMAAPACVVGGIGLLLYWQNSTGNFASWTYAWTLIPGFVGVGKILEGLLAGHFGRGLINGGWLILISLVMFAIFASFLDGPQFLGIYWPVLLIGLGIIALIQYFVQPRD